MVFIWMDVVYKGIPTLIKPCSDGIQDGIQIVQARHVFNVSLRGFVHFATKEGALRVLEESARLSFLNFVILLRILWAVCAIFRSEEMAGLGSITYHRRKLDIKAC